MTRTIKEPEVRKAEILHAAEKLFKQYGYEKTPIDSIIKEAGIAKGTFYYYFKSKKDILDAMVEQARSKLTTHFSSIIEAGNLTGLQKLEKMLRGPEKNHIASTVTMEAIHQPENRELQEKLTIESVKMIAPLLALAFKQGHDEGVFASAPSVESIQVILAGSEFILSAGLFQLSKTEEKAYLTAIQHTLELLAGAKPNSLHFISD